MFGGRYVPVVLVITPRGIDVATDYDRRGNLENALAAFVLTFPALDDQIRAMARPRD